MCDVLETYKDVVSKMIEFAGEYRKARGTSLIVPLNKCFYEIIGTTATLGVCRYPWCLTRIVLAAKWEEIFMKAITEYNGWDEKSAGSSFESAQKIIVDYILKLAGPPVTLQRICELLKSHPYNNAQKLFNAFRKMTAVRGLLSNSVDIPEYVDLSIFPILNNFNNCLAQNNLFTSPSSSNNLFAMSELLYTDLYNDSYDWLEDIDSDNQNQRSRSASCSFYEGEKDEQTRLQRKRKIGCEISPLHCEDSSNCNSTAYTYNSSDISSSSFSSNNNNEALQISSTFYSEKENEEEFSNSFPDSSNISSNKKTLEDFVYKDLIDTNTVDYECENVSSSSVVYTENLAQSGKSSAPLSYFSSQTFSLLNNKTNECKTEGKNSYMLNIERKEDFHENLSRDVKPELELEQSNFNRSDHYDNYYLHKDIGEKDEENKHLVEKSTIKIEQKKESVCRENNILLSSIFTDYGDDDEDEGGGNEIEK